jgi:6-phosphofructokinase
MDELKQIGSTITGLITAVIGIAILAVILSNRSATVNVIGTFFSGLSNLLQVTLQPVTAGGATNLANSGGFNYNNSGTNSVSNALNNTAQFAVNLNQTSNAFSNLLNTPLLQGGLQ